MRQVVASKRAGRIDKDARRLSLVYVPRPGEARGRQLRESRHLCVWQKKEQPALSSPRAR